ncbi:hypothetical protein [Desulfobacter vibrioformis]|uniref:hypothetical protein n=1 Tax=Desulfobacter vibrioformis TaxID=34031 RepID=UPI000556D4A4|nr:hypothetical protein [Desulfobacter vibrioformis]
MQVKFFKKNNMTLEVTNNNNTLKFDTFGTAKDVKAYENALGWLTLKSARFKQMMADIGNSSTAGTAYVVASNNNPFTQGKFFSPDETSNNGWPGELAGKPVVLVSLIAGTGVMLKCTDTKKFVGDNLDLFAGGQPNNKVSPVPKGWTLQGKGKLWGVATPLIGLAHELGHLWQYAQYPKVYNQLMKKAIASGVSFGDDMLRIEINNIINNEAPICWQMGEASRFHYEFVKDYQNDFLYKLPDPSGTNQLPMLDKAVIKGDWPKQPVRTYNSCQGKLEMTGDNVVPLTIK